MHDVLPPDQKSGEAKRATRLWPGDVYKTLPFLSQFFGTIKITIIRTYPTGLAVLTNIPDGNGIDISNECLNSFDNITVADFYAEYLDSFTNIAAGVDEMTGETGESFGGETRSRPASAC